MPAVELLCEKTCFDLKDVDFFCAVVGPGSFTGIRIGVAAIKGFADAYDKPVLSVTSFDALSYNESDGKKMAIIDAAHGKCYRCGYDGKAVSVAPAFTEISSLKEYEKEYRFLSFSEIEGLKTEKADPVRGLINAVDCLYINASDDVDSLSPYYLRLSQAEEGRL